jgi:hypothetical protein
MIWRMYSTHINTKIILETMLRWIIKLFHKLTLSIQLDLNQHLRIGNTMFHFNWRILWTGKTWLMPMIWKIGLTHINTITILETTPKRIKPSHKLIQPAQLVLNHHLQTTNMMFHSSWRTLWTGKIWLMPMIWKIDSTHISMGIILATMPSKISNLSLKSTQQAQLV